MPQVVAVQFDEVEGVEEYLVVSAVVPDEIERGNTVVIAGDSFAVVISCSHWLPEAAYRFWLGGTAR